MGRGKEGDCVRYVGRGRGRRGWRETIPGGKYVRGGRGEKEIAFLVCGEAGATGNSL